MTIASVLAPVFDDPFAAVAIDDGDQGFAALLLGPDFSDGAQRQVKLPGQGFDVAGRR